jgi:hypothetical protein
MVLAPCDSDSVGVLGRITFATPYGNPGCLPLSKPTKYRRLKLERQWGITSGQALSCNFQVGHANMSDTGIHIIATCR